METLNNPFKPSGVDIDIGFHWFQVTSKEYQYYRMPPMAICQLAFVLTIIPKMITRHQKRNVIIIIIHQESFGFVNTNKAINFITKNNGKVKCTQDDNCRYYLLLETCKNAVNIVTQKVLLYACAVKDLNRNSDALTTVERMVSHVLSPRNNKLSLCNRLQIGFW